MFLLNFFMFIIILGETLFQLYYYDAKMQK